MKKITATAAFSLVEVVLALGVVSFAILSLVGLIAAGVIGLNQSMNASTVTMVSQSISSEVAMASYSNVTNSTSIFWQSFSPARYYDMQGVQTNASSATYVVTLATVNSQVPGVQAQTGDVGQQLRAQIVNLHLGGASATNNLCIWAVNNGR
jgi:uncharacterized protein (TIGR02598 family)